MWIIKFPFFFSSSNFQSIKKKISQKPRRYLQQTAPIKSTTHLNANCKVELANQCQIDNKNDLYGTITSP